MLGQSCSGVRLTLRRKKLLDGQLMKTTLKNPKRILDIGTGTGTWAIDVADLFSKADVIGIDLSPIQCPEVPPNCHFFVDDCEGEWDWEEHFDLIHGRCLGGSIANWRRFYKQCYRNLVPGGHVELQEHDFLITSQSKDLPPWTSLWLTELNAAFKSSGKDLHVPVEKHIQLLEAAGFVDVKVDSRSLPIGPWAKDERLKRLGEWNQQQMLDLVESYSLAAYTDIINKSLEETQVTIAMTKSELREKKNHLLIKFHFMTGTKPCVNST